MKQFVKKKKKEKTQKYFCELLFPSDVLKQSWKIIIF